jgi:hypothetical protein
MERCPICRAMLNGADTCRRCRAELGSAIGTEHQARRLLGEAMFRLTLGDRIVARRLVQRSLLLHRTREALAIKRLLENSHNMALKSNDESKEMADKID